MIYSFVAFLILFVGIGIAAHRKSIGTTVDYLLANKEVKPSLAGLSLFATEASAIMFVGMVGVTYAIGLSAVWILFGWYFGEAVILALCAKKVREQTDAVDAHTFSGLLSSWTGDHHKYVQWLSAAVIVLFLSVYAAAQFSASGKALNVALGWDLALGAFIGFAIVMSYCMAGGLRATIWTDALQGVVMILSLFLIVLVSLNEIGGLGALWSALEDIDPELLDAFGGDYKYGVWGFAAGWIFAGMGVLGQPHVMVRFMVVDRAQNVKRVVGYFVTLVTALSVLSMLAALCARVLLPELIEGDPELSLPMIAADYLPPLLSGMFLAGLFSAIISSADSMILSSSAALTRDLFPKYFKNVLWVKAGTILIGVVALGIVLSGQDNVFKLAAFAWSIMAASMAPLLFMYMMGQKSTQTHALIVMILGASASIYWEYAGLSGDIYNVLPGILVGLISFIILKPVFKS